MVSTHVQKLTETAISLFQNKEYDKALRYLSQALEFEPNNPAIISNIGGCYLSLGQKTLAKKYFQQAISENPDFMQANYNLANIYFNDEDYFNAAIHYARVVDHATQIPDIYLNLATSLVQTGKDAESEKYFKYYLALKPNDAEALSNLGVTLSRQGKYDDAIEFYKKASGLNPQNWDTFYNLGILYSRKKNYEQAIEEFEKLVRLNPKHSNAMSHLVNRSPYILDWERKKKYAPLLDKLTDEELSQGLTPSEQPFMSVIRRDNPQINLAIAKAYSMRMEKIAQLHDTSVNYGKRARRSKKIRVGYVSDGFRDFPTGHNFVRVLEVHDKNRFEVTCYSHGPVDDSIWYNRITKAVNTFVDIRDLADHQAAKKIREDNIDILVDLKGHTNNSRLLIFAYKPAPIQISYLGFPGSTGANFIDYAVVDATVVPKYDKKYWTEKLIFMPYTYRATDNKMPNSLVPFEREDFGLPENTFIFGSFNSPYKLEREMYDVWMQILREVPNSVLWQLDDTNKIKDRLKAETTKRKVNPDRIIIAKKAVKEAHLARMKLANLILDTDIVNGHTTTVDALWAGVPVIALYGNHFCSRVSASVLRAIDLPELVAQDFASYQKLAVNLANNPNKLQDLVNKLTHNKTSSPLFNSELFTNHLESAYKRVYDRHKKLQKPANIHIHA